MRRSEFRKCLEKLRPEGTYLLWGEETFLSDTVISRLKTLVLGKGESSGANYVVLYAGECRASDAIAAASSQSFFGTKSLVLVRDIQEFAEGERKVLKEYLETQPPVAVLVLTDTTKKRYKATSHPIVPNDKSKLIDVSPPWDNEFEDWARALASGKKKSITPEAIESLRENVGLSITNLAMEIEKLACLAGDEREINEEHIAALLGRSRVETEFALADAVVSGNRALALTLLSDLLREGSAIPKIMWAFRRGYETVWRAKEMLEGGASSDSVVKALKMSKRQSGPVLNAARGFQADDLRKALGVIFDADVRMRSQKLDERLILEMLLLALCNLRAAE